MSRMKKVLIGIAVLLILALAVVLVPRFLKPKEAAVTDVPPVVAVESPVFGSIELTSEVMGTIEQDNTVYVTPKGSGEITEVKVQAGDQVEAGQVLCVIDTKQVEAARLTMETAKVGLDNDQATLNRMAVLHAAGDVSDQDFEQLSSKAKASKIQYESAKLGYQIQLENSQVTAPIAGKIETLDVEVHDMVSPQAMICVISGEGSKVVTFYVSERIVEGLSVGMDLKLEKNGSEYHASVTEVSSMIDQSNGLFKVKAAVSDGDSLAIGSSVKLYIVSQRVENVLTVPVDNVYYEGGTPYIYTYAEGEVRKNEVVTGLSDSHIIEIQSGISKEDQVITTWTSELYDGSKVRLAGETAAADEAKPDAAPGEAGGAKPDAASGEVGGAKPDAAPGEAGGAKPDAAPGAASGAKPDAAPAEPVLAAE